MKLSNMFLKTLRDIPADVRAISHNLLLRGSFIRKTAPGLYCLMPPGNLVMGKIKKIIKEELEELNCQELSMPLLLSEENMKDKNFSMEIEPYIFHIKDQNKRNYSLALDYGETITELLKNDIRSYKELPLFFYTMDRAFLDEGKPKGGLLKPREFFIKSLYSFHSGRDDLKQNYDRIIAIYKKIFEKIGLKVKIIESITGGCISHKFFILNEYGKEDIIKCPECNYEKSIEKTEVYVPFEGLAEKDVPPSEYIHTPGKTSIEEVTSFMNEEASSFIKTIIYSADNKPVIALVRGDREINSYKLAELLGAKEISLAGEEMVREVTGAPVGFAGPVGLKDIRLLADLEVRNMTSAIVGGNKKDYHIKNVKIGRDFEVREYGDIRMASPGDRCTKCGKELIFKKGLLLGQTILLDNRLSHSAGAVFLNEKGEEEELITGYYSLYISQIMAAIVEENNDKDGIIWPSSVSPYSVIILLLNPQDEAQKEMALKVYDLLKKERIDTLLDDRDIKVGAKFKDSDLLGIPLIITVGSKSVKEDFIETGERGKKEKVKIKLEEVAGFIENRIELYEKI